MQQTHTAVFAQSLGKQVSSRLGPKMQPRLTAYPSAPLPLEPRWDLLQQPHLPVSEWERLSTLLWLAAGPIRQEVLNPYKLHRSSPSPRSLFPVHLHIETREALWHHDPFYAELRPDRTVGTPPSRPTTLWITGFVPGIPENYGTLRPTLVALEGGHLLHTLQESAHLLGYRLRTEILEETPPEVLHTLHLDDQWRVLARVDLLEDPLHFETADPTAFQAMLTRSSGHGVGGLCASNQTLDFDELQDLLFPTLPCHPELPGFRLLVSLRTGPLKADLLELHPDGFLSLLQPEQSVQVLQQAYGYSPLNCNFGALEALIYLVMDYPKALQTHSFQAIQVLLGQYAQALGLQAARAGRFVRPARAFQEVALDTPLRLQPSEMVAYLLLLGEDRLPDLAFPLYTEVHA